MSEEKLVKLQIQLPEKLRTRFKSKCVLEGATMNQVAIELLEQWTNEEEAHSKPGTKQ
jgi:hypothetical protein